MNKKIMILDTEFNNNFVYDIGFIIAEKMEDNTYKAIEKHQFINEQIYYNYRLFTSSYYKTKRKKYTSLMKGKKAIVKKYGYITQIITNVLKKHNIKKVYAYNSGADKSVMAYTSKDFKVKNPFENIEFHDIMAIANNFIHLHKDYIDFAIKNQYITSTGYLETTAEKTYRFLINDNTFIEKHTALADSEIELDILNYCIEKGYLETKVYKGKKIKSQNQQILTIHHKENTYKFEYLERKNSRKQNSITLT